MRKVRHIIWLLATILLLTACTTSGPPDPAAPLQPPPTGAEPRGRLVTEVRPAPAFTLTDHHGQPFSSAELSGKVVVLSFGYTHCPDVCPLTVGHKGAAAEQLGELADRVRFLFVTVDPERDTPARLNEYLGRFPGEAVIGLTGDEAELAHLWQDYRVGVQKVESADGGPYTVDHSVRVWFIDTEGRLRLYHLLGSSVDDYVNDILFLLSEAG